MMADIVVGTIKAVVARVIRGDHLHAGIAGSDGLEPWWTCFAAIPSGGGRDIGTWE